MKRWRNLLGFALLLSAGMSYGRVCALRTDLPAFGREEIVFTALAGLLGLVGMILLFLDEYHRRKR